MNRLRRTYASLVFLLAFSIITAPAFGLDVDSLLLKSVGGPKGLQTIRTMSSYYAAGRINMNGQDGRFIEVVVPPNRLYFELQFNTYSIIQAYDGVEAWQKDLNGRVSTLSGYERKELMRAIYFETFSHVVPDRVPGEHEYLGDTTIQGVDFHALAFHPMLTDTVQVLFEAETGLRRIMVSHLDNILTVSTNDQFRPVNDALIPFEQRAVAFGAPLTVVTYIDTTAFNIPVDMAIFSRPGTPVGENPFPAGRESVEIPFEYVNGHIFVKATINGRKRVRLILDSGASATIFHSQAINELELPVVGTMPARGVAGFEKVALVRSDSLAIGDITLYGQIGGSVNLGGLAPSSGVIPFGGIIGYDFLSRFPMMVDYKRSVLVVFEPEKFEPPTRGHTIDFDLTMQVPTVEGELGGVRGKFLVDLGNAFGLIVHEQFATENRLLERFKPADEQDRMLGGIGGGLSGRAVIAPKFTIGTLSLFDLPVIVSESSTGLSGSTEIDGNIGNELLRTYRVVFDYQRHQLHLLPTAY